MRRGLPEAHAAIPNLAPMVDVVMVILIFFMLGTTFAAFEGVLPTRLPANVGPGGSAKVAIVPMIRIALLGPLEFGFPGIRVMDHELRENSFAALGELLRGKAAAGADTESPVLLAADPDVAYQHVISAMDACVQAGFGNIQFSVSTAAIQADLSGDSSS